MLRITLLVPIYSSLSLNFSPLNYKLLMYEMYIDAFIIPVH